MSRRLFATLVALLAVGAACGGPSNSPTASTSGYRVMATTSVFADLARLALGNSVQIDSIVPAGIDVHTFEPSHHHHLVCVSCGAISEVDDCGIEAVTAEAARRSGFEIQSHRLELFGRCPRCQNGEPRQ